MKEYCVYWFENGEPRHEVFSCLDGAEMFSCMIRGQDGVEHVEISEEDISAPEGFREICPGDFSGTYDMDPGSFFAVAWR